MTNGITGPNGSCKSPSPSRDVLRTSVFWKVVGLAALFIGGWLLTDLLRPISLHEMRDRVLAMAGQDLSASAGATATAHLLLACYDLIALRHLTPRVVPMLGITRAAAVILLFR